MYQKRWITLIRPASRTVDSDSILSVIYFIYIYNFFTCARSFYAEKLRIKFQLKLRADDDDDDVDEERVNKIGDLVVALDHKQTDENLLLRFNAKYEKI